MNIYIDRHYVEGATKHAVAHAHEKDLEIQDKYGIKFLTYWFDEERSTAFCLIEAPDKESLQRAHDEAHGLVPHEIIEVDRSIVQSFLGRLKDPAPSKDTGEVPIDSAFRAIMFTDLQDSTLMTTLYGDAKALHLLHIHNVMTRNKLRKYDGSEVKHTGDGIMASFKSVTKAVECAQAVQLSFDEHNKRNPDESLYLRIGISAGEPIEEHGDLFGRAVQLSARLCSEAKPGETLVDQIVHDLYHGNVIRFTPIGEVSLKGFNQDVMTYKVE